MEDADLCAIALKVTGGEQKKIFLYRGLLLLQRFQNNGDFNLT